MCLRSPSRPSGRMRTVGGRASYQLRADTLVLPQDLLLNDGAFLLAAMVELRCI